MRREIYARRLKLSGEEHVETPSAPINYALNLIALFVSKKPRLCCAERRPWRGAFSEIRMSTRSG